MFFSSSLALHLHHCLLWFDRCCSPIHPLYIVLFHFYARPCQCCVCCCRLSAVAVVAVATAIAAAAAAAADQLCCLSVTLVHTAIVNKRTNDFSRKPHLRANRRTHGVLVDRPPFGSIPNSVSGVLPRVYTNCRRVRQSVDLDVDQCKAQRNQYLVV